MYDYSYQWAGLDHNTQCVAYGCVTLSTLPVRIKKGMSLGYVQTRLNGAGCVRGEGDVDINS